MKKIFTLGFLMFATGVAAQNSYSNAEITSTSDVIGTARYVGMGGAMGALGADISAISDNPASIGLFRKSDVSLTAGALWPKDRSYKEGDKLTHGTFDQMGFVTSWKTMGSRMRYFNFAFNYQKKFNLNSGFYADNDALGDLSQADQLSSLSNSYYVDENITGTAYNAYVTDKDELGYYNSWGAYGNQYAHWSTGSMQAYDINFSGNVLDRYYWGITIGCDNLDYDKYTTYTEFRDGDLTHAIQDYSLYNDQHMSGFGVNFKLGTVIRPIEDNPLRIGVTVETPTWYTLKSSTWHSIDSKYDADGNYTDEKGVYFNHKSVDDSYIEYRLRTPWRARVSLGSTVENFFAWGLGYEYANYGKNHMFYTGGSKRTEDDAMNELTKGNFQGQHTFKMGFEGKPLDCLALRFGYNYVSRIYKDGARLNQDIDSYAMDYSTSTAFMNLSDVNIITCGLGFKHKAFYADLAYKYRRQTGSFYAFDDSFTRDPQFIQDNPGLANAVLDPVDVNLSRHMVTCTLGFKF